MMVTIIRERWLAFCRRMDQPVTVTEFTLFLIGAVVFNVLAILKMNGVI